MCGKGVDQTTRSPQQWLIHAPELQQKHAFAKDGGDGWRSTFNEAFTPDPEIFDVWSMLARPVTSNITLPTAKQDCRMGLFDLLSNELIEMIFEYVAEDPKDTIALGFTCEGFWHLVASYIQSSYIRESAPWADTKLIFQGSWSTDLPGALVACKAVEGIVEDDHSNKATARKLFWASWNFDGPVTNKVREVRWREAMGMSRESGRIPEQRWSEIERLIGCDYLFPKDRTWVLRNLTTREFVSSEPQMTKRRTRSQIKGKLRFENVLLMKTCWTNYALYGWEDLDVHRGSWAGHRLDIVAEDVHLKETTGGWRDVTEEIKREWDIVRSRLESFKRGL